jgi:hypothetical protein
VPVQYYKRKINEYSKYLVRERGGGEKIIKVKTERKRIKKKKLLLEERRY